jgi:anti-sigma-K factor RskA
MSDVERYQRAGDYVFGLMDSAERARAERDLELDDEFRLAVSALTARIRAADREIAARERRESGWETIAAGLAALPQMQGRLPFDAAPLADPSTPAAGEPRPGRSLLPAAVAAAFALGVAAGFLAGHFWASAQPAAVSTGAAP